MLFDCICGLVPVTACANGILEQYIAVSRSVHVLLRACLISDGQLQTLSTNCHDCRCESVPWMITGDAVLPAAMDFCTSIYGSDRNTTHYASRNASVS